MNYEINKDLKMFKIYHVPSRLLQGNYDVFYVYPPIVDSESSWSLQLTVHIPEECGIVNFSRGVKLLTPTLLKSLGNYARCNMSESIFMKMLLDHRGAVVGELSLSDLREITELALEVSDSIYFKRNLGYFMKAIDSV